MQSNRTTTELPVSSDNVLDGQLKKLPYTPPVLLSLGAHEISTGGTTAVHENNSGNPHGFFS